MKVILKTPNGPILNGVRISKGIHPVVWNPTLFYTPKPILSFDLSKNCIEVYYYKIFKNRTQENKLYIDKYSSIDELEEDIYGDCNFGGESNYKDIPFKEVYNKLDKKEFLHKINEMIEEHGNMIVGDLGLGEGNLCVKSDKSFKLGDFLEYLRIELTKNIA